MSGKDIALNEYIRKVSNNLNSHLKNLAKEEKDNPKASKWKEITKKIWGNNNKIENKEKSMKPIFGSSEKLVKLINL